MKSSADYWKNTEPLKESFAVCTDQCRGKGPDPVTGGSGGLADGIVTRVRDLMRQKHRVSLPCWARQPGALGSSPLQSMR